MKHLSTSTSVSRGILTAVLLSAFALAGCGDPKLHAEITEFDKSVQALETPIRSFYSKVNDAHRDLYIDEVKMTPGTRLLVKRQVSPNEAAADSVAKRYICDEDDTTGTEFVTGLKAYYSDDYVKVRILSVRALAKYSGKLNELATSTAPSDAQQSITKLGTDLKDLSTQLDAIASKHKKNSSLNIASFSTPIANLTALAAGNFLEWLRDKWLKDNLSATNTDIKTLCKSLEDDLEATADRVKSRAGYDLDVHEQAFNLNGALLNGPPSSSDRTQSLTDSAKIGKVQDDIDQANPAVLVRKVELLHDLIVDHIGKRKAKKIKHGANKDAGGNDG